MAKSFNFSFYLNTTEAKKKSDGRFPIYLRIIINRKKSEMALDHFLLKKDWNPEMQRAKKSFGIINEELNQLSEKILVQKRDLDKDGIDYDAKTLKDIISGKEKVEYYLVEYFQNHIDFIERNPTLKRGTISRYKDTISHLKDFLKKEKSKSDILIGNADISLIKEFESYLLNYKIPSSINSLEPSLSKTLERNTVNKHLVRLKTIFIKAHQHNIVSKNPFGFTRLKYTPSKREFLTQEELDRLINLDLSKDLPAEKVRDAFIWQVYTGMRYDDARNISVNQIQKNSNGRYEIVLKQPKTGEIVNVQLLKPALNIIKKYNTTEREITGKILPYMTNQHANRMLKFIAREAKIKKPLTTHIARHTCATTILLSNEVPIEAVSEWLGHTNIKTTQIYAKISNQYLSDIAGKVDKKINKK